MDDSIAFNVIHSNKEFQAPTNGMDVLRIMSEHTVGDVHLNATHGRSVVLRNFNTDRIMEHQLDHRLRPLKAFLNEPLKKGLSALGERAVYNDIIDTLL